MRRFLIGLLTAAAMVLGSVGGGFITPASATVNSSTNRTVALGNGSQTQFTFNFIGVAAAYMTAIYTDASGSQTVLTQGSGTTQYQIVLNAPVQGAIWGLGGTVTYNPSGSPIAVGTTLTIYRTLPLTQAVSLQNLASISTLAKGSETGLDTGVMQGQQINEQIGRAIVANITNTAPPLPLPPAAQIANLGACFDATGLNMIACSLAPAGIISSAMQPVVSAATLALGRTAFGLGSAAVENIGSYGMVDDGAGNLRQNLTLTSDSINQTVSGSYHLNQRICTGPISYSLNRANTLWNGFGFRIYAVAGNCTVTPNANDNFQNIASGVSISIPQGSSCFITTNAASSGLWEAECNNAQPSLSASSNGTALTLTLNATALAFRDTTLANGDALWGMPAANLAITIPGSATLGTANNVPFRGWIFAAYNAGAPVLGVATCSTPTTISPCAAWETIRKSGTAISSGATSAGTLYTSAGVTNDSVRIIGYFEYPSGLAAAGTWASTPTTLQVCMPPFTCKRPGDVVQNVTASTSSTTSVSSTSKAVTNVASAFTVSSNANLVKVSAFGSAVTGSGSASAGPIFQLWRNTAAVAVGNVSGCAGQVNTSTGFCVTANYALDGPASSNWPPTQYTLYATLSSGSAWTFLGTTGAFIAGPGIITIEEIMGALDEPVNDNEIPDVRNVG